MQTIFELVTLECQNEHDLEHDLEHRTQFSTPKIFDANGDISKRWYVYFSYRNPETGKLERQKNIYGQVNRFKTKSERYTVLNLYKKRLLKFLRDGYSPFEDNTELHLNQTNQKSKPISHIERQPKKEVVAKTVAKQPKPLKMVAHDQQQPTTTIEEAFEKAILLKTNVVSDTTLKDYKSRTNQFTKWLADNRPTTSKINQVSKKMVVEFLNSIQLGTSARNRNNYRTVLSSLFQLMEDNELIQKNFISQIKVIRTKPKRHKTYSLKQQEDIFNHLEINDKLLLLYIKFISYNLLRPIEVCRLRVRDINIKQGTLQFRAKNKPLKTKIIPDILLKELPNLSTMDGELLLFTPDGIGGKWDTELSNRREYFSKRFKKVVKNHFGLNENYGLYSFRHTFITKLYRALNKNSSPHEAKSKLMQITGHSTMTALEKYLRDIDAELPEDYSELL